MFQRFIILICTALVPVGISLAAEGKPHEDPAIIAAWHQIMRLDFAGAEQAFRELVEAQPNSRHARLGLAMAQLNTPPQTRARLDRVTATLEAVHQEQPNDELGILAQWQLARMCHAHFVPYDLAEAARRYEALYRAHPDHFLGQSALLRLATIELFSEYPPPDMETLVTKWETRVEAFTIPMLRRNMLQKIGDAILWFEMPRQRALPHFLAAQEIGFSRFDIHMYMLLRIYNISSKEGFPTIARAAAKQFVREFPRDPYAQVMRDALAGRPNPALHQP